MKPNSEFEAIESAWWKYVNRACPHPIHSRLRYAWIRENRAFVFDDKTYQRDSVPSTTPDGHKDGSSRITFRDIEDPERAIEGVIRLTGISAFQSGDSSR